MKERDWETLVWSLEHGSCILLLGPDVPLDAAGGPPSTLEAELAEALAQDLTVAARDLPAVAQEHASQFGRSDLERQVVRFYEAQRKRPSEVHAALAALPFGLIVTSGHDSLYEEALRAKGKAPRAQPYHYRGDNAALLDLGNTESPLIYQLYGSPREPSSLVLTEHDLLDFLVAVVSKNPPLPNNLRSELRKKGRSFLFVGFGLRHWHLRILLHVLGFSRSESRSFALEPLAARPSPEFEQAVAFYRTGYRIEVYDVDLREFVGGLRNRFGASITAPAASASGAAGPQAPKVFICHASEDREVAERIQVELSRAGLRPWLDRSSLESGADWDREIEEAIQDVDYFVIVQSRSLADKSFSYLNKEIHLAMRRQSYARRGIRFIIPVHIDDSPLIDDLKPFQALPLRSEGDLPHLSSSIKRDFQRRARQL